MSGVTGNAHLSVIAGPLPGSSELKTGRINDTEETVLGKVQRLLLMLLAGTGTGL